MKCLSALLAFLVLMRAPSALAEEVTAASDVGFAPYSMSSLSGGFEGIDIAKKMSEYAGINIKRIQQPWSTTFAGLAAGKFDVMWAAA